MVTEVERAAALGPEPAVGTEVEYHFMHFGLKLKASKWLAPKDWLGVYIIFVSCISFFPCISAEMEANRRLQKPSDPGFQARINEARKQEEDDKKRGDPMVCR